MMDELQYCPKCDSTKLLNPVNFYRNASRPSGYDSQMCKACRKVYVKDRHKRLVEQPFLGPVIPDEPETFTEFDKLAHDHKYKEIRSNLISTDKPIEVAVPLKGE